MRTTLLACVALLTAGTALAEAPAPYELNVISNQDVLRIDVSTGATQISVGQQPMVAILEQPNVKLPSGDYHLHGWSNADNSGWGAFRFDAHVGRLWRLFFDGKEGCWVEVPGVGDSAPELPAKPTFATLCLGQVPQAD